MNAVNALSQAPLKAVLFDLDGTLVDTAPDFVVVVNELRRAEGLEPLADELIRNTVSNGARALIRLAFQLNEGEADFQRLHQALLDRYLQHLEKGSQLFPGIAALLEQLGEHGIAWGIVTNKPERFTTPLLAAMHWPQPAATVICPDHVSQSKPHPEPLLLACRELNCEPENIIYIGDHRRDIDCGRAAGCKTIAVSYGYIEAGDCARDWQADNCVDHANELWPIIRQHL